MRRSAAALRLLSIAALALVCGAPALPPEGPADWLAGYLRIDTSNPPGGEHRAAAYLAGLLHRRGIATRLIVSPAGRANLYARIESGGDGGGPLVLLHHMDVVPPGPGWSRDPFSGELDNGRLWGRGAVDAKSLGIAHLAAFLELAASKEPPRRDVIFLAVADEESGGDGGVRWLLDHHPELFEGVTTVLGEGGQNRTFDGKLFWWGIEVAQKRPLWLELTAGGRGGHGSSLNLHTAPHRLIRALQKLVDRPLEMRLTPEVRAYYEAVAPYEGGNFRRLLAEMDEVLASPAPGRRLFPGMPSLLADSLQVNVLQAGERINVTPDEATARIDIRMLPDTDAEALLAEIRGLVGDGIEVDVLLSSPRAPASPSLGPSYDCLGEFLGRSAPVVPAFIPGVTDSRHFRERGIPAYGLSPFALEGADLRGIHGPDERIPLGAFERGVDTMIGLVRACAGG